MGQSYLANIKEAFFNSKFNKRFWLILLFEFLFVLSVSFLLVVFASISFSAFVSDPNSKLLSSITETILPLDSSSSNTIDNADSLNRLVPLALKGLGLFAISLIFFLLLYSFFKGIEWKFAVKGKFNMLYFFKFLLFNFLWLIVFFILLSFFALLLVNGAAPLIIMILAFLLFHFYFVS